MIQRRSGFTRPANVPGIFAALAGLFAMPACAIWYAGVRLADATDILDERWKIGAVLGGAILLAVATNLPEIAITASAAWSDNLDVAIGNILGGIAVQTVALVTFDAFGVRDRAPLTCHTASLVLVLEGLLLRPSFRSLCCGDRSPMAQATFESRSAIVSRRACAENEGFTSPAFSTLSAKADSWRARHGISAVCKRCDGCSSHYPSL
jgi:hypothetical protein